MSLHHRHGHAAPAPGHHDHHDHHEAHRLGRLGDRRRMLMALGLTGVLLVAEVVGGFLSNSRALLADAQHMLSDLAAQGLSLFALLIAARPSDRRRTYGYYRFEILAALANGMALFALSAWIIWSAVGRLRGGPQHIDTGLMMAFAVAGLAANLVGLWLLHGAESLNVKGAYLHVLQDTLSSVAVIIGAAVMSVFAGVAGIYLVDTVLAIAIGLFVNVGAWRLVRDAVDVLLEAVPLGIDLEQVSTALRSQPRVREVHDLHLWTITSGIYALSAHVVTDGTIAERDDLLAGAKELLARDFRIHHMTIQVESHGQDQPCVGCEERPRPA